MHVLALPEVKSRHWVPCWASDCTACYACMLVDSLSMRAQCDAGGEEKRRHREEFIHTPCKMQATRPTLIEGSCSKATLTRPGLAPSWCEGCKRCLAEGTATLLLPGNGRLDRFSFVQLSLSSDKLVFGSRRAKNKCGKYVSIVDPSLCPMSCRLSPSHYRLPLKYA